MNPEDKLDVFGDFDPAEHEREAVERWAGPLLEESQRRTSSYGKEQWKEALAEGRSIAEEWAEAMRRGVAADGPEATALAERHRLHIDRWFYPCSHEQHVGLGEMYVDDDRFAAYWDSFEPGLASFVRDGVRANAGVAGE